MCAAVFVDPAVAFLGLYAILPQLQGRGLGIELWTKCMDHVNLRNAGLYAVPEQLSTYRDKAGFSVQDSRQMLVFEADAPLDASNLVQTVGNVIVKRIDDDQLVIDYDEKVLGYRRERLLELTFKENDSVALVALDKFDGHVVGYGCMRTNNVGKAMAGPIYADNDAVAELLVSTSIKELPAAQRSGLLYMAIDSCPGGVRIAEKLKLNLHERLPRFFTRSVAEADFARIYCIHTPNFSPF